MKIIVRAFVVVLALTGAVASTQTSVASARTVTASSSLKALPIPTCEPGQGGPCPCNVCAMGK